MKTTSNTSRCCLCANMSSSILLLFILQGFRIALSDNDYLIGVGSADITGPAADVNMMGYANAEQIASGVHFRLRSRAFIVAQPGGGCVAFVNLDACMASQIVTIKVLERLKSRYGDLYNEQNLAISGIHTHAGPGGYLQHVLYIITSIGFVRQSFDAIVDGIERSIVQAHDSLQPGSIFVNKGEVPDAGVNRSPSAYLNNPQVERDQYVYDVDKDMTLLKFVNAHNVSIGSFNWFATHGTSMSRTNSLISGDNKGAAARFMEDWLEQINVPSILPPQQEGTLQELAAAFPSTGGNSVTSSLSTTKRVRHRTSPGFICAFCQSNVGDVSPNVLGAVCSDTGLPCDFNHSTCNGRNELCYGRGPGYPDEFVSTRIIGQRQFDKALELFNSASEQLKGRVDYRHTTADFSSIVVNVTYYGTGSKQETVRTCPASVGFAFAAGTTDGPGAFDFKQDDTKGNEFWRLVRNVLTTPSKEQVECQRPKPILLDTGEMNEPYPWAPSILPLQILRIGQLIILSVPGELTTMAGRRLRDAVKAELIQNSNGEFSDNIHVVIAGLTNTYSQYVTTYEEYQVQRYEGASTLYGSHTLSAYIQEYKKLAAAMKDFSETEPGPPLPDLLDKQISLLPPNVVDLTPIGVLFGDVYRNVPSGITYNKGDKVVVSFWSACPRNDLLTEGTFALVEMLHGDQKNWVPAYDDDDFSLCFRWKRLLNLTAYSIATMEWTIPSSVATGVYRISHFGSAKPLIGSLYYFTGSSNAFVVL